MQVVTLQTFIFVCVFAISYLFFIVYMTARQQMDLYDLVMLSAVAIVPTVFVIFPQFAYWLADIAGVKFPFVVMFGMLFVILFVFIHRLTVKLHRLEYDNRMLIQELSLHKQTLEQSGRYICQCPDQPGHIAACATDINNMPLRGRVSD